MRYVFRQLPPLLRAVGLLGLLFLLIATVLNLAILNHWFGMGQALFPRFEDQTRIGIIALNLTMLGSVCFSPITRYAVDLRRAGRESHALAGWRGQVVAPLFLATVPLCAIMLTAISSPTSSTFQLVFPCTMLAVLASLGANIWAVVRMQSPTV